MHQEIILQSVELMLYGMGMVVVFLTLLVVATSAMSKLVVRYFPEAPTAAAPLPSPGATAQPGDEQLVAVIGAALRRHREKHRR